MYGTEFEPGEPGGGAIQLRHPRSQGKQERRLTGHRAALQVQVGRILCIAKSTSKSSQQQAYSVRLLKQRYGLSRNYAAFVAAEFRWGDAR